ncbi:blue light receptor [Pleurotus ostreatus]|uniref:Blue light receptor n=1 Tax=Pleurotus ostreatus TaxID=5322 RepID=A0A8H7A212_PLEOS|nr:blue light receptor [Pleurotus ostreatus]KAF7440548.1 blue light receptor [Pleurotus ostreatus]
MSAPQPSGSSSSPAATTSSSSAPSTFEFTKRKRWADLLINELADAIILVLSSSCTILFSGAAVTEILGWRDVDLVDKDFMDLVACESSLKDNDQTNFQNSFHESLRTSEDLLSYTHLKCKTSHSATVPREILFEIKGYPHYVGDEQTCRCFFATAKPYPSRNAAMLNTFLDLKTENERLQQRLAHLRATVPVATNVDIGATNAMLYSNPLIHPTRSLSSIPSLLPSYNQPSGPGYYVPPNMGQNSFGALVPTDGGEDDSEDALRKKRLKKSHTSEQYVCITCGRTDSPEWRKGPQGPKTLCNACGLRWAKQIRRTDESNNDAAASAAPERS